MIGLFPQRPYKRNVGTGREEREALRRTAMPACSYVADPVDGVRRRGRSGTPWSGAFTLRSTGRLGGVEGPGRWLPQSSRLFLDRGDRNAMRDGTLAASVTKVRPVHASVRELHRKSGQWDYAKWGERAGLPEVRHGGVVGEQGVVAAAHTVEHPILSAAMTVLGDGRAPGRTQWPERPSAAEAAPACSLRCAGCPTARSRSGTPLGGRPAD